MKSQLPFEYLNAEIYNAYSIYHKEKKLLVLNNKKEDRRQGNVEESQQVMNKT